MTEGILSSDRKVSRFKDKQIKMKQVQNSFRWIPQWHTSLPLED